MQYEKTLAFARKLDRSDPLKSFRSEFHLPSFRGKPVLYFSGNSLGLQPKAVRQYIEEELEDWASQGVEGHFKIHRPWVNYHYYSRKSLARLTGSLQSEVVAMNQLTVNLHLLLVSFYSPSSQRYKIIIEESAFPSDQYALESQVKFHGYHPEDAIVELKPRPGEFTLKTEDIVAAINDHKNQLALVLMGGVQYYTGQFFKMKIIAAAAHQAGAYIGFDLAHAIGNVPLSLHEDKIDFGVWCSYKYLNSGPGGIAGVFIHDRHAENFQLPRFAGWWGHQENERFLMRKGFKPMAGAAGWQLSNFPVISGAAHLAALDIFDRAGMKSLRKKSILLTGFLEFLLYQMKNHQDHFQIFTPANPDERGCQLSIHMLKNGKRIFKALTEAGVRIDWREPDVIRVAPVPLYNSFVDVYQFFSLFNKLLNP